MTVFMRQVSLWYLLHVFLHEGLSFATILNQYLRAKYENVQIVRNILEKSFFATTTDQQNSSDLTVIQYV
jgi:hypothetical protein